MLDRLGDEKTIEGVAMVPGEIRNSSGGSRHNRQLPKASLAGSRQKDVRREVEIRTPEAELDRDLEDVHRAEQKGVGHILEHAGPRSRDARRLDQCPDQHLRVEQNTHLSTFEQIEEIVRQRRIEIRRHGRFAGEHPELQRPTRRLE